MSSLESVFFSKNIYFYSSRVVTMITAAHYLMHSVYNHIDSLFTLLQESITMQHMQYLVTSTSNISTFIAIASSTMTPTQQCKILHVRSLLRQQLAHMLYGTWKVKSPVAYDVAEYRMRYLISGTQCVRNNWTALKYYTVMTATITNMPVIVLHSWVQL